jgi:hypothetical protein
MAGTPGLRSGAAVTAVMTVGKCLYRLAVRPVLDR